MGGLDPVTIDQEPRRGRLLGFVAVGIIVTALVTLVARDAPSGESLAPPTPATNGGTPTPMASPSPPPGPEILASPTATAAHDAATVLAVANGATAEHGLVGDWPRARELPVYVANVTMGPERRLLAADQVLVLRLARATDVVVLRFLPAAGALGVDPPFITGAVDGEPATLTMDPVAALLRIDLGRERPAGDPLMLRLSFRYSLVDADTLRGDGPIGYGLLSRDQHVSVLSHWLPLLTHDEGAVQPTGDLGSFPAAIWSLEVVHPGVLVTGGLEGPCKVAVDNCTRVVGAGLRDVGMLVIDDALVAESLAAGHRVRAVYRPDVSEADVEAVLAETVAALEFYTELFGDLAWSQTDIAGAPLSRGAAGMEYPGMFILRDDLWRSHDRAFGSYVIAHEVAHQWFHALVGNSSLTDPVVDEAIAQYLSILFFAEQYGEAAASDLAAGMRNRYDEALADGLRSDPPAQALADFASAAAYGALVYGRAPLAFVEAEEALGRAAVVAFLAELVAGHALAELTDDAVLDLAREHDADLGTIIERWWFDGTPS